MGSGPKHPASWIHLLFLCSMLPMWSNVEGWSYFYSNTTMNWEAARTWCRQHYTDMVAIQNQEEIQYLNGWLPPKSTYYWIGIRKINNAWTWVGTNKKLTTEATNWAKDEPNNGNQKFNTGAEDCVEMYIKRKYQTGKWNDEPCEKLKAALCYSAACKPDSCHYGECVETINSHMCNCTPGFLGDKCEQVMKCDEDVVHAPENGNVNCTHEYGNFSFNSSCRYSCKKGYQLNMERPQRCNESGSWSEQRPTCELVQCQNLTLPSRGSMKCSHPLAPASYGSTCVYTCDEGYVFDSSPSNALTLQCESSGSWNASQPSCVAVQCPALQHPENGIMSCESEDDRFSYGKTCSFSCSPGYQLLGQSRLTCTSEAKWNEQMPRCEAVQCPALQHPENGIMSCESEENDRFSYGKTCSFSCSPGYQLLGRSRLTCTSEAKWSKQMPRCEAVQCPALQHLENGIMSCESEENDRFSYGKTCSFSCSPGYQLLGQSRLTCTSDAKWSEQMPRCEAVQCPALQHLENGIMSCESEENDRFSYGKTCSFSCSPGYQLLGQSRLTCTSEAKWNEQMPRCEAVQCPALEHLENGIMSCESEDDRFSYGKTCSFSCSPGYLLLGQSRLTCTSEAKWSEQMPRCEAITCKNPKREAHLISNCHKSLSEFPINSTCSFTCEQGFELQGVETAKCSEDGQWSEDIPTCRAVRCLVLEDPENGHINCSNSEPLFNTQCSFTCDQDYSLNGHEMLTCDHYGNWTGGNPTCEASSPSVTVTATSAAAGAASVASGLCLALWILKRLRQKASKFALNSTSDMSTPPEVYKSSIDSLI